MRFSWMAGLALALACTSAAGEERARAAAAACPSAAQADADALSDREDRLSQYEAMPAQCRKAIVVACAAAASDTFLDLGTAAECSIGYEALLRRDFGGNFQALLAWWQNRHADPAFQ